MKGRGAAATAALVDALTDPDPIVREWAIEALVRRKAGVAAVPDLLRRLRDDRADVRWYAARALGKLNVSSADVAAALEAAVRDADEFVRAYAVWAIGALRLQDSVAALRARLRSADFKRRGVEEQAIGVALARLNTPSPDEAATQEDLFSPDVVPPPPAVTDRRPPTRTELFQADILATAEKVARDRVGGAIVVRGALRFSVAYARSVPLKERVLEERGRECQLCGFSFTKTNGEPYAECHHIKELSDGGKDEPDNLVVVCPNHHKMLHFARVDFPDGQRRPTRLLINGEEIVVRWPAALS